MFASLDDEFVDAVLAAEVAVRLRRPLRVLAPLRRVAEMEPCHELVQASLVTTLAAAGHQAEALMTYRLIRERLAEELGVEPGPELREAYRRTVSRPPAVAAPVRPAQLPPDQPLALALLAARLTAHSGLSLATVAAGLRLGPSRSPAGGHRNRFAQSSSWVSMWSVLSV